MSKLLKNFSQAPDELRHGFTDFLGCKIGLTWRVLTPRPETEFWTKIAIEDLQKAKIKKPQVLDIFCGSGCIGIAVAKKIKGAKVDFADVSDEAIAQTKINLAKNDIGSGRSQVIKSNLFDGVALSIGYDAILANPPYIDPARINEVQTTVLDNEPSKALFGGEGGLKIIYKFLEQAKKFLKPRGFIYLEFDPLQKAAIEEKLRREKYSSFEFFKDQFGRWRFVKIDL